MKSFRLTLIALILTTIFVPEVLSLVRVHRTFPPCKQTKYNGALLALTWIGQYCSQNSCSKNWKDVWDGVSFVIHGYWPQSDDLATLSCLKEDGYDRYCDYNYSFDQKKLSSISRDLKKYWPQIGAVKNFWKYEWDKHGTCYLKITLDSFNSQKLSTDDIFLRYFRGTINKLKALSVQNITKFEFSTKDELGKQIHLGVTQFIAVCGNDNELDQIRICYNLAEPEKQQIKACTGKPKQCKFPVILKRQ